MARLGQLRAILYELQPLRYSDLVANVRSLKSNMGGVLGLWRDAARLLSSLRVGTILRGVAAVAGLRISHHFHLAELYCIALGVLLMFTNLSTRKNGDDSLSAWSVFNDNFVNLLGTLRGEDLDREIRNQLDPIFDRVGDEGENRGNAVNADAGNNKTNARKSNKKKRTEKKREERLERQRLRQLEDELLDGEVFDE